MAKQYGNWINDRTLSEGGQARVYLVYNKDDKDQHRRVLKRLKNNKRLNRFRSEIDAITKLDHPNVVKLLDFNLDSESPYLVTEYCSGGTLSNIDFTDWPIIEKLHLFNSICEGVAHAHNHDIIHRDLKPDNIFLREDGRTPVVGDFGICFITDSGERVTLVDEAVGARNYTAPELEDGRSDLVNKSVDVYSLGKILYWIISGRIFSREKHREFEWNLTNKNQDVASYKLEQRAFINELLDWSVASSPDNRFTNARHFKAHVERTIRRIKNGAHPIDTDVYHICNYCGIGHYKKYNDTEETNSDKIERFGIRHVDQSKWMLFHCDYCGHIQQFRVDNIRQNPWKGDVRPW